MRPVASILAHKAYAHFADLTKVHVLVCLGGVLCKGKSACLGVLHSFGNFDQLGPNDDPVFVGESQQVLARLKIAHQHESVKEFVQRLLI
jgi:hypothetical protein